MVDDMAIEQFCWLMKQERDRNASTNNVKMEGLNGPFSKLKIWLREAEEKYTSVKICMKQEIQTNIVLLILRAYPR